MTAKRSRESPLYTARRATAPFPWSSRAVRADAAYLLGGVQVSTRLKGSHHFPVFALLARSDWERAKKYPLHHIAGGSSSVSPNFITPETVRFCTSFPEEGATGGTHYAWFRLLATAAAGGGELEIAPSPVAVSDATRLFEMSLQSFAGLEAWGCEAVSYGRPPKRLGEFAAIRRRARQLESIHLPSTAVNSPSIPNPIRSCLTCLAN